METSPFYSQISRNNERGQAHCESRDCKTVKQSGVWTYGCLLLGSLTGKKPFCFFKERNWTP